MNIPAKIRSLYNYSITNKCGFVCKRKPCAIHSKWHAGRALTTAPGLYEKATKIPRQLLYESALHYVMLLSTTNPLSVWPPSAQVCLR